MGSVICVHIVEPTELCVFLDMDPGADNFITVLCTATFSFRHQITSAEKPNETRFPVPSPRMYPAG